MEPACKWTSVHHSLSRSLPFQSLAAAAMDRDTALIPSSLTNSSPSSSDLDTESTGSFFPDRSMTLGTLMGVNIGGEDQPDVGPTRASSRGGNGYGAAKAVAERRRRRTGSRGSWWRLCRDDTAGPTSLGEFLQVERRSLVVGPAGEGASAVAEVAGVRFFVGGGEEEHVEVGRGRLFENGRVLPPAGAVAATSAARERRRREKVPVLLAGICSGG